MERRTAIIASALLVLGTFAAIQLADPQFGERTAPEVDFSEPPNEIAADAATQFEYVDYSYRIDLKRNGTDDWIHFSSVQVDHTNRRYRSVGPLRENGTIIFGNDAVTFAKPGPNGAWHLGSTEMATYPARGFTQPFSRESIVNSNIIVLSRNSSFIVFKTDSVFLKLAEVYPGHSTFRINRHSGLISEAVSTYQTPRGGDRQLRFTLVQNGTEVDRPSTLPLSGKELFWDLLRGPLI